MNLTKLQTSDHKSINDLQQIIRNQIGIDSRTRLDPGPSNSCTAFSLFATVGVAWVIWGAISGPAGLIQMGPQIVRLGIMSENGAQNVSNNET